MKDKSKNRYSVPNLERALRILEFLADKPMGSTISELSTVLEYPKNSVFRILKTLTENGYLNENDNNYKMSTKVLFLGYSSLSDVNLIESAIDIMRDLRDEVKETVLIGSVVDVKGVVLEQVPSSYEIKFMIDVGHIFYPHTAAPGKAIIAFYTEQERDKIIKRLEYVKFNDRTISNQKEMMKCLNDVREKGYAVDNGERIEGLRGVASPVLNHWGYPIASIWTTGPSFRMQEKDFSKIGEIVKKHAVRISNRLGFNNKIS